MSKYFVIFKWLLKREYREVYHSPKLVFINILTGIVALGVYWYTSKAFAPSVQSGLSAYDIDYFTYILIGDLTFVLPAMLFIGAGDCIRRGANDKTLETMLILPYKPQHLTLLLTSALIPIELVKVVLTLTIAVVLFKFRLPLLPLGQVIFLQILSIPLFSGLSLIAASILLRFSRGDMALGHIHSFAIILAGSYFPITVLPETVKIISEVISPFSVLLQGTREILHGPSGQAVFWQTAIAIFIWGVVMFILGYWLSGRGFWYLRKKGAPILFFR